MLALTPSLTSANIATVYVVPKVVRLVSLVVVDNVKYRSVSEYHLLVVINPSTLPSLSVSYIKF